MANDALHVSREIASQAEAWTTAVDRLPQVSHLLPRRGERVAVVGCGTSWFMAAAYATLREHLGEGETDSFAASEFPAGRQYDRVVAISRSGTTTEVVRAVQASTAPVLAISGLADCPVVSAADTAVVLDFASEQSVVQTVFATTALMLLRASVGDPVEAAIAQVSQLLRTDAALPPEVEAAPQFSFLGQGWAYGIALEAALKMREATQTWTEAYPQMEYRHGPVAIAEPGRVAWIFGSAVAGLRDDIARTGAILVDDDLDPVVDLVRVQLLSVRRALRLGLDADHPRSLTKSVLLGEDGSAPQDELAPQDGSTPRDSSTPQNGSAPRLDGVATGPAVVR